LEGEKGEKDGGKEGETVGTEETVGPEEPVGAEDAVGDEDTVGDEDAHKCSLTLFWLDFANRAIFGV
jgi:hypothetical protein